MRSKDLLLLIITLAGLCVSAMGQAERISQTDYEAALAAALDAASSRDRRVRTELVYYTGSQVTGKRRIVSDFVGPDAKRVGIEDEFNGKRTRFDSITLDGQFLCRDGDKAWKKADKECAASGNVMAIPDGQYEYFREPDTTSGRKTYIRRAIFRDAGNPERDAARLKFIEIRFVIDENGVINEYTELRRGGREPGHWSSTQVTRYEYEPAGLRINDPTKDN